MMWVGIRYFGLIKHGIPEAPRIGSSELRGRQFCTQLQTLSQIRLASILQENMPVMIGMGIAALPQLQPRIDELNSLFPFLCINPSLSLLCLPRSRTDLFNRNREMNLACRSRHP